MSRFLPLSDADRQEMLRRIGVERIDSLFDSIPADGRFTGTLNVPLILLLPGKSFLPHTPRISPRFPRVPCRSSLNTRA